MFRWSNYNWEGSIGQSGREPLRSSRLKDPGPNYWSQNLASVDSEGALHLRLAPCRMSDGSNYQWSCSEINP